MSIKTISNRLTKDSQWENFSQKDHHTWSVLFNRQSTILQTRAAPEVLKGMEKLSIRGACIPKFSELNKILQKETNFSIIPVEGLVSDDLFFKLLSQRKFPSTCFIRKLHQLDYLEEPDIFHDVFGHVPLLVNPVFADFMQAFGFKGLEAIECGLLEFAATLYWFTVEFSLINTEKGLRIYGAGITSSKGESIYALESKIPVRVRFNLHRLLKTQYHIDFFQKTYFVIKNFKELFDVLKMLNWEKLRDTCLSFPEIEQGIFLNNQEKIF